MSVDLNFSDGSFSSKLLSTLDRIEYRRIETQEDFEDIARLRYRAYKSHGVLPVAATELIDDIDFDPNAHVLGVYYDEELVSTIRVHYVTPDHRVCQSTGVFPDAVHGLLDAGLTLIDPARFAADPDMVEELPAIPYLTLRPAVMAAIHFDADMVLQHIRPAHSAFYRRIFSATTIVPPTPTAMYGFDLTLLSTAAKDIRPRLMKRFAFFRSEAFERRMMFERSPHSSTLQPLTILPTARLAGRPTSPEMAYVN